MNLRQRDPSISLDAVTSFEFERIRLQRQYDDSRRQINENSKKMSKLDRSTDEFSALRQAGKELNGKSASIKTSLDDITNKLRSALLELPNVILPEVPISQDKEDKQIVRVYGSKPEFYFSPVDHVTLGEKLGILDFKRGAKIAESGFPIYVGKGAILEWALINFMIDTARASVFQFVLLPFLNNTTSLVTTGNLPKFADELYTCKRDELHLIPTAETPLTNLYRDETLAGDTLPVRLASYSPCFRREAGAAGKMTRGLMRIHQFNKLETYSFCLPEQAKEEHERLIKNAESLLEKLGLHYRLANLPSCDLAQQSSQTFDIEVWLPYLGQYSEVSSASNCQDYQARRANIKYKTPKSGGFVTTLNCSALATPRVMISLLESNQTSDGHIIIPEVLKKYTDFDRI